MAGKKQEQASWLQSTPPLWLQRQPLLMGENQKKFARENGISRSQVGGKHPLRARAEPPSSSEPPPPPHASRFLTAFLLPWEGLSLVCKQMRTEGSSSAQATSPGETEVLWTLGLRHTHAHQLNRSLARARRKNWSLQNSQAPVPLATTKGCKHVGETFGRVHLCTGKGQETSDKAPRREYFSGVPHAVSGTLCAR